MIAAAIFAAAFLIVAPSPADLAAQTFRADLFSAHGFLIWNDQWYAGHSLPGYSVLYPPLGALFGPRLVGVLAAVAAAGAFAALARPRYGDRARMAIWWFGAATASNLVSGRITFALGLAVGLGAMVALDRQRTALALVLGVAASLASPVAGLFLTFAAAIRATLGDAQRSLAVAAGALASLLAVSFAFPTPGWEPFAFTAFLPVPLTVLAVLALVPSEERWLRRGAVAYGLLCVAFALVHSPVGGNVARLGALLGGPLVALTMTGRRPAPVLMLVAAPLLYWQWATPARDLAAASGDPTAHRAYFRPLLTQLDRDTHGRAVRVEIPPTDDRWEAAYVAPRYPLARGWLRQPETRETRRFTDGHLAPGYYRRWLDRHSVSYVAVADAKLDYTAVDEVKLIDRGLPYLRPIWRNSNWRLYRVRDPAPLASGRARLVDLDPSSFSLSVPTRGRYVVRIHYTPYWTVASGSACVSDSGPWTRVSARRAGTIAVEAEFSLGGLFRRDRECSE